ncbi:MAG TPA: hypothetical protein VKR60_10110 [Candidatus Sulfotelmatobacter sp.]|nr:hypothetical protein [Candidatus Sulfotelmatobacter sp.]
MRRPTNALHIALVLLLAVSTSAQQKFPVVSAADEPTIAGRPVALDAQGKLLPWPMPDNIGYSYSSHVLSQWTILWDQYNRQRLHYFHCCFDIDRTTYELIPDQKWANSTGYLRAMMQGFIERLYPYTGDERMLTFLEDFVDYELEHGTTPAGYAWARVPYASADPGVRDYKGWSSHGTDYIEPHVVGEDGYAYLRLYEMTGNTKYLQAAIRCADALVKNYKKGDATHSPWPVRCYAKDGSTRGEKPMGPYSANVIEPIMLFDELMRLHQGEVSSYARIRRNAWLWFQTYPLTNNVWVGYFEDVVPSMENMNQVIPLEFARYVLLHPEKDPQWREHASKLIEWVKTTPKWPKYIVHGAMVTTEQGNGIEFCCNLPNQCCDSHTSRLAAVEALYFAKTEDESYREAAFRSYNWVTYFQGLPGKTHAPWGENQWWFTDEFADGPRRLMDSFWAVPEWAPADESHLLGSSSVVTKIAYGKGSVTYSTFEPQSTDVLRLDFVPDSVTANGWPLTRQKTLPSTASGFTFEDATHVLRIRHSTARDIDIQGCGGSAPPLYVTFDNPHLAAGTVLEGAYPSGVIDWPKGEWKIGIPDGKFGTFNLIPTDPTQEHLDLAFHSPRVFVGVDVYNGGSSEATLTLRSGNLPDVAVSLHPGELRRIRTLWKDPTWQVTLELKNGENLRFDNLAYLYP